MTLEAVKDIVENAMKGHFAPSILKDLFVFAETDSDGEPILLIQVIVDEAGPKLSADKVFYATGVVRTALAGHDEARFPLLTYLSSDEISGVAA